MPIPYNIWGADLQWLTYGYHEWYHGGIIEGGFSFLDASLPPQLQGEMWTTYQVLGFPGDPPTAPFFNPNPWNLQARNDEPYGPLKVEGYAYDHVRGVLTHALYWDDPNAFPDHDWEGYGRAHASHLNSGKGEVERWDHTYTGQLSFDDPIYGLEVLNPGAYEAYKYMYSSEGGLPLLAMSKDEGLTAVSWDWGENWSTPVWPEDYYPGGPWDGGCYTFSEVCQAWGPEGSDTFCVAGGNDCWRTKDNGQSMDITYAPYDYAGDGLWDPERCNAQIGDFFTLLCNEKQDPDCLWIAISYFNVNDGGGYLGPWVQRNTTPTCEPEGWENEAYYLVSGDFQEDIFEGTVFHPDDHSSSGIAGDPYTPYPLTIGMKYLPGTERWWAFGMGHNRMGPVFSDDDGKTWSKALCDHKTEANWPQMHPFISPRMWPYTESYQTYLDMNQSGWWWSFNDIIEHPDDPQIVITLGECWLTVPYDVSDPAGRWDDGIFYAVRREWTEEAEILKYPEYNPHGGLKSMGGFEEVCLCVSRDGGLTWDRPFSVVPFWDAGDFDLSQSRLVAVRR